MANFIYIWTHFSVPLKEEECESQSKMSFRQISEKKSKIDGIMSHISWVSMNASVSSVCPYIFMGYEWLLLQMSSFHEPWSFQYIMNL